jgi:hypothetical protein
MDRWFYLPTSFFPNTIALGLDMFSNDEERLCANKSVSRRPLFLMGSNIQEMEDAIKGKMMDLQKVRAHSLGALRAYQQQPSQPVFSYMHRNTIFPKCDI